VLFGRRHNCEITHNHLLHYNYFGKEKGAVSLNPKKESGAKRTVLFFVAKLVYTEPITTPYIN